LPRGCETLSAQVLDATPFRVCGFDRDYRLYQSTSPHRITERFGALPDVERRLQMLEAQRKDAQARLDAARAEPAGVR